ncbi:MarR family winged helix-turn-helix transcriptional regulator [Pendulispora brunnea]|uniref:MarR family winged helix-turn-helix transcriptional regulator n=1 Tax=Pendulispora brunnea TaxID=2905690 RepID=A0ABZ2K2M2_9BACT
MYSTNKPGSVPCACTTVKKLSRVLGRAYDAALAGSGVNNTQLAVLKCIARREGDPLSHIADELEMERSSLYRAVSPMERDGWLTITAGPDARSRTATLTRKGHQVVAKANTAWEKMHHQVIDRFGRKEWMALSAELDRLANCAEPPQDG